MNKKEARLRRSRKTRAKIAELKVARLCVHRSNCHIYAQVYSGSGDSVVASASTLDTDLRAAIASGGNVSAAKEVGKAIAIKAIEKGITEVAFDRSGYKYHGRIKALADSARENGLKF
jgi:large subunit ribosomal protein L18